MLALVHNGFHINDKQDENRKFILMFEYKGSV
jgi:hypothetical protein